MKPFAQWVSEQAESIVDGSHIGPHTHHLPDVTKKVDDPRCPEGWTPEREAMYEQWMRRMEHDYEY